MGRTKDIEGCIKQWGVQKAGITRIPVTNEEVEDCMALIAEIGRRYCENFVIDDNNRFVFEQIIRWMLADPNAQAHDTEGNIIPAGLSKGLYIAGRTGTGKTLLLAVFSVFAKLLGIEYWSYGKRLPLDFNFYRADLICDDYAKEGDLQKFKQMPILCIEDLGCEEPETLFMGNRKNVLRSILEARGDKRSLLTFATSNIRIDRLGKNKEGRELYGDRVQSRAFEMWNYYILGGKDRRK